ncbi:hypothetical protein Dimus_011822 [Dionaea muscipula]
MAGVFRRQQAEGEEEEEAAADMASTAVDSQKPIKVDEEKNKQKKGGKVNRKPLQEIGNIVAFNHVVEGKLQNHQITCPITKTLCKLSLEATDPAPAADHQEEVARCAKGISVARAPKQPKAAKKEVTFKPELEQVIVVSPDEEEEEERSDKSKKQKVFSESNSCRKHDGSVVLNARKVDRGITTEPKDNHIVDIDAGDANNELAVVEYVDDIYKFYKLTEDENRTCDYMHLQSNINEKMRLILVDWLVEVHNKFELMPETLYLTIDLVDRFLSRKAVSRRELQLVGIGSMLLASKYEEIWAPEVKDFVCISDEAYTKDQVLAMEKTILGKLEWNLTVATPYVFLARFIKATAQADKTMENMALFLAETGLMHYPVVVSYSPSLIAAAAVYGAIHTTNKTKTPSWTETLKHYTGYSEVQLRECAKMLTQLHAVASESKFKAVYRKFSNPKRGAVALFPPARCLLHHQA